MKSNKKILVVCQHFWPENFRINDIADFLVEKGCQVDVLCGLPNYPKGKLFSGYSLVFNRHEIHNNINIRRVFEVPRGNNSNFRIFANYISFPIASLFHIPRLLFKKYDKILLYQLSPVMMSIAGIIIGKIKKTETIMYVLDLWPENLFSVLKVNNKLLRKIAGKISYWHYKRVDKIMVLSEQMKGKIKEVVDIPDEKIIIIPQACEKLYEKNVADKVLEKKFSKGFNIVFTGNISPAQSFETIIEAAKKLSQDNIKDINWVIVGDGMSRKWLEDEVKKAKLSNFFFEGFRPIEDMPKYTNIADVLIGCLTKSDSLEATLPAKVYSYIASGKPIILAMDSEAQDLIQNIIKCGFAGPAGDADSLYDNINKMYNLPESKRKEMGKLAHKYHFKYLERSLVMSQMYDFIFDLNKV